MASAMFAYAKLYARDHGRKSHRLWKVQQKPYKKHQIFAKFGKKLRKKCFSLRERTPQNREWLLRKYSWHNPSKYVIHMNTGASKKKYYLSPSGLYLLRHRGIHKIRSPIKESLWPQLGIRRKLSPANPRSKGEPSVHTCRGCTFRRIHSI